ncbi:MAG: ABC transporter substrate-binding protein [Xanthobacteraceae bacterium]
MIARAPADARPMRPVGVGRREFVALLGGAAAFAPFAALAQQPPPLVGFLNTQSPEAFASYVAAFRDGLRDAGYIDGQNVAIEYRWARDRNDILPVLATELVARRPAVIATSGGELAARAVKSATSTIPIVFLTGGDPVEQGLVQSFNRPGGNATGMTQLTLTLDPKRLGLLRDLIPEAKTIALLLNPTFPGTAARERRLNEAGRAIGLDLIALHASSEAEIEQTLSNFERRRADAVLVGGDPFFNSRRNQIVALTARLRIPAMYEWRDFVAAGGLMSYGTHLPDAYRQAGMYSGRILKGEKPADMPVLQPTQFKLILNLKTAGTLGLTFPPSLLALADEVIE